MSCCPHCSTPCAPSDILSTNGLKWLRCSSCLELTDCSALDEASVESSSKHADEPDSDEFDDDALTLVINPIRPIVRSRKSGELIIVREIKSTELAKTEAPAGSRASRFWPRVALPAAPSPKLLMPKPASAREERPRSRRPVSIPPLPVAARFPSQPRVPVTPPPRPVRAAASAVLSLPQLPPLPRPRRIVRKRRLPGDGSRPRDAMLPDSLFLVPSLARFFAPADRLPPSPAIRSSEIHPRRIALASGLALIAVVSMLALGKQAMVYVSAHAVTVEQRSSVHAAVPPVVSAPQIGE